MSWENHICVAVLDTSPHFNSRIVSSGRQQTQEHVVSQNGSWTGLFKDIGEGFDLNGRGDLSIYWNF